MSDLIEHLNDRDDVAKTEYTRYDEGEEVTVELWHDIDGLHRIAQRAVSGAPSSKRGMQEVAEDEALVTRKTRVDTHENIGVLYPETMDRLESE